MSICSYFRQLSSEPLRCCATYCVFKLPCVRTQKTNPTQVCRLHFFGAARGNWKFPLTLFVGPFRLVRLKLCCACFRQLSSEPLRCCATYCVFKLPCVRTQKTNPTRVCRLHFLVRPGGLEPPRISPQHP